MESKNIGLAKIHKFCGNVSWVFFSHMDQNSGDIIKGVMASIRGNEKVKNNYSSLLQLLQQ